jgi:tRNA U54 and U55 pseudouridine synthase Pus10
MLGEGRPFVMEIINPRGGELSAEQLRNVERTIIAAKK